jgi:hypothetical protein
MLIDETIKRAGYVSRLKSVVGLYTGLLDVRPHRSKHTKFRITLVSISTLITMAHYTSSISLLCVEQLTDILFDIMCVCVCGVVCVGVWCMVWYVWYVRVWCGVCVCV